MATASRMKPGSGGGAKANAMGTQSLRKDYSKGSPASQKHPAKKPGVSGDARRPRKSPLSGKK